MANKTKAGYELAHRLQDSFDQEGKWSWSNMVETCSLIARHAKTYHRIQEGYCDGCGAAGNPHIPVARAAILEERFEKWLNKREAQLEARLIALAGELPLTSAGPITVRFAGDPRGATVTLVTNDGRSDNWDHDGFMVH